MTTLLQIDSSILGNASASGAVTRRFVESWKKANPHGQVVRRDLTEDVIPHISLDLLSGFGTPAGDRSALQSAAVDRSDALIAEIEAADTLVIGAPMYNFSIPSSLKAWIDHVVRAQKTFRYTAAGSPEGLLRNKKVYVVISRGGIYSEGAAQAMDFQEPYLRAVLGFIGLTDIEFIRVEGLKMGEEKVASAMRRADEAIAGITGVTAPVGVALAA